MQKRADRRKYHYIYQTTNLINEMFYIGMHSTDNLDDGYIGSGKRLWHSVNYHGRENFKMEILEFLPDRKSLAEREAEIVNEEFLKDQQCMNLKVGGTGGGKWFNHPNSIQALRSYESQKKASEASQKTQCLLMQNEEYAKCYKLTMSNSIKKYYSNNISHWVGKHHSIETKRKIGDSNSIAQAGEKNSQFGKCWVYNEQCNKSIKKEDLDHYLSEGWIKGRKMKFNVLSRGSSSEPTKL